MNYRIQYEDMVIVGERGQGASGILRDVAAVAAVAVTLLLVLDRVGGTGAGF